MFSDISLCLVSCVCFSWYRCCHHWKDEIQSVQQCLCTHTMIDVPPSSSTQKHPREKKTLSKKCCKVFQTLPLLKSLFLSTHFSTLLTLLLKKLQIFFPKFKVLFVFFHTSGKKEICYNRANLDIGRFVWWETKSHPKKCLDINYILHLFFHLQILEDFNLIGSFFSGAVLQFDWLLREGICVPFTLLT